MAKWSSHFIFRKQFNKPNGNPDQKLPSGFCPSHRDKQKNRVCCGCTACLLDDDIRCTAWGQARQFIITRGL